MVPKQGLEKAEAACLLSNKDYTFAPHRMQLSPTLHRHVYVIIPSEHLWLFLAPMTTNQKKYIQKIFAFLDILGFEELVNESRKNPELINKIANTLRRSKKVAVSTINAKLTVLKVDPTQYRHLTFSDTSVISGPYISHDDIDFLSTWIIIYQYLMWKEERTFIRGAIVYGDIYEDEDVLFGPALIDAYHLEKDKHKAAWPRVLIDESLLAKITEAECRRDFFEFMRLL